VHNRKIGHIFALIVCGQIEDFVDINELHIQAVDGDKIAEAELFKILSVRFRYFTYQRLLDRNLAEETVQDTLMLISQEYSKLEVKTSFMAWAYNVLINKIKNHYRKYRRRDELEQEHMSDLPSSNTWLPDPDFEATLIECLKKIGIRDIRYARILNLKHQGFTTEEICQKLNIAPNYFYVILFRSRSLLKECLESGEIDNE